ncbi:efflux RND transporter periplasmic adaptor subunit, partial [Achromobacter sp. GG226]|uniref:efflux RND transporter periplasmic adaptor subunit n=1 Tax=Verticiella alkaliphila TaxID=2779529 RepID=UPI001C0B0D31
PPPRAAQARAGLKARANQSDYAVLRADADGVVTGVDAEVGQVVSAGQPVVRVARTASKEIAFQIPETRIDEVRALQQAQVELWAGGPVLQGRVREIAASADPATRAFPARLALENPPPSLRFGMTATVRFTRAMAEPAVRVPLTALFRDGQATAVWVLGDDGHVRRVPVQLLTVTDTEAVIRASLPPGAEIVTAGVHVLREGQQVKRLAAPQPAPPASAASAAMLPVGEGAALAASPR